MTQETCNERVWSGGFRHICGKKAKEGGKCGIHCASAVEKRKAKSAEKYKQWNDKWNAEREAERAKEAKVALANALTLPEGMRVLTIEILDETTGIVRREHSNDIFDETKKRGLVELVQAAVSDLSKERAKNA